MCTSFGEECDCLTKAVYNMARIRFANYCLTCLTPARQTTYSMVKILSLTTYLWDKTVRWGLFICESRWMCFLFLAFFFEVLILSQCISVQVGSSYSEKYYFLVAFLVAWTFLFALPSPCWSPPPSSANTPPPGRSLAYLLMLHACDRPLKMWCLMWMCMTALLRWEIRELFPLSYFNQ